MRLDDFYFELPKERIALYPAKPRDSAKLLLIQPDGLADKEVLDLPNLLKQGDLLVLNNSYVVPARIAGKTEQGRLVDVLLCHPLDDYRWRVMMKGKADKIIFSNDTSAEDINADDINADRTGEGELTFNKPFSELYAFIEKVGKIPLPPYIESQRAVETSDSKNYQTIYHKKEEGWSSIAAPTAGLHFTDSVFSALAEKGIEVLELTLHVGLGTFLPIKSPEIEKHTMPPEQAFLSEAAAEKINQTKQQGGRVIAVGTTSLRVLESAAVSKGKVKSFSGTTDLFIYPSYDFQIIDGLLTNFHLPKSTPLLLVAALMGWEQIKTAYAHALKKGYRFFSYGDACLLLPK